MAVKKGAKAPAKQKKQKVAKPPKKAAAPKAAAPGPANQSIGANSRIPTKKEMEGFFNRLDRLFEAKASKNAEFMTDIKAVYEEASSKLGVSRKVFRLYFGKYQSENRFADTLAELEPKETDDVDRLMAAGQAFGEDTPFGAYCVAQGGLREGANAAAHDEVQPPPSKLIKAEAAPAANDDPAARGGFAVGMADPDQVDDEPGVTAH